MRTGASPRPPRLPNPGKRVEALGQAVGFFGGHREHLMAGFLGLEDQLAAARDGVSYVVTGTILGNLAHAGADSTAV